MGKFKGAVTLSLMLGLAQGLYSLGFNTQPPVEYMQPAGSFEMGEGAINSMLNYYLRDPIYLTSPTDGSTITVRVKRVQMDIEPGTAVFRLRMMVQYPVSGVMKSFLVNHESSVSSGALTYTHVPNDGGLIMLSLPTLQGSMGHLNAGAQQALVTKFGNFLLNPHGLFNLPTPPQGQISPYFPVFFMGMVNFSAILEDDRIRFSLAPSLEVEPTTIKVYKQNDGSQWNHKITVITNFSGQITDINFYNVLGETRSASGLTLQPDASASSLRYKRYNGVILTNLGGNFPSSGVYMELSIKNGMGDYKIQTQFQHGQYQTGWLSVTRR